MVILCPLPTEWSQRSNLHPHRDNVRSLATEPQWELWLEIFCWERERRGRVYKIECIHVDNWEMRQKAIVMRRRARSYLSALLQESRWVKKSTEGPWCGKETLDGTKLSRGHAFLVLGCPHMQKTLQGEKEIKEQKIGTEHCLTGCTIWGMAWRGN